MENTAPVSYTHLVVCSIPSWESKSHETSILLCRRAIAPRHGFWTLPGGFMENDETTEQAAVRLSLIHI